MRAAQIGHELRLHDVAALPAKLVGFHVNDSPVADLASDNYVGNGHDAEEDRQPPQCNPSIRRGRKARCDTPPGDERAERDQRQTGEEYSRNRQEKQNPEIRITRSSPHVQSENEEPRASSDGYQRCAENAQPVTGQEG